MNPDAPKTPREALEARLTALLLGELSAAEAAAIRELIAHDAELAGLHDRLQQAIALVREVVPAELESPVVSAEPLQLSEERRKKLLTSFKIPPLKPADRKPKSSFQMGLVEVLAVVGIVGLLAAMLFPSMGAMRSKRPVAVTRLPAAQAWGDDEKKAPHRYSVGYSGQAPSDVHALDAVSDMSVDASKSPPVSTESVGVPVVNETLSASPPLVTGNGAVDVNYSLSDGRAPLPKLAAAVATPTPATSPRPQIVLPAVAEPEIVGALTADSVSGTELSTFARSKKPAAPEAGRESGSLRGFYDSPALVDFGPATERVPQSEGRFEQLTDLYDARGTTSPSTGAGAKPMQSLGTEWFAYNLSAGTNRIVAQAGTPSAGAIATNVVNGGYLAFGGGVAGDDFFQSGNRGGSAGGEIAGTPRGLGGVKVSGGGGGGGSPNEVRLHIRTDGEVADDVAGTVLTAGNSTVTLGSLALSPATPADGPATGLRMLEESQLDRDAEGVAVADKVYLPGAVAAPAGNSSNSWQFETDVTRRLAEVDGDQVAALGEIPVTGRLFRKEIKPVRRPLVAQGSNLTNSYDRPVAQPGAEALGRSSTNVSFYAFSTLNKAAEGELTLSGANIYAGGAIVTNRQSLEFADYDASGALAAPVDRKPGSAPLAGLPKVALRFQSGGGTTNQPSQVASLKPVEQRVEKALTEKLVQDGRRLLESGKRDQAAAKFKEAVKLDPNNQAAFYYLSFANERRATEDSRRREQASKDGIVKVELDWTPQRKPSTNAPIPQPEIQTSENNFSTFSLNVSDVSFKLAMASLEKGQMPDAATVRTEEFINAFDYRDPEPAAGLPIAFAWERSRYPFAHNRDLLRFSLKTAAAGRQAGRPLNIVLLLDNSGSMERADRVSILREALRVLAAQLQPQDKLSVITFARTPRLVVDGISGDKAGEVVEQVGGLTPQGGTNLEDAMNLAYQTAAKHYLANGINRVVMLTDGAANLGNVEPESLKQKVEAQRKQGIALDCFGIGWEGFNDDLLEVLSRNGDGRYGFINSPEEASTEFAAQLAGALKVAASDVKVQVEFNPKRTTAYRQIGYAKHQLTKEQFRDNTVDAAEIAAQEAGNALYTVEVNPTGEGPLCTVRVRYKIPGTTDYREQAWDVPYIGNALLLEQSTPAMRLAASASAFAEWLVASPFAGEVTPDRLLSQLAGVPEIYGADTRPKKLEWMIRQAKSLEGK